MHVLVKDEISLVGLAGGLPNDTSLQPLEPDKITPWVASSRPKKQCGLIKVQVSELVKPVRVYLHFKGYGGATPFAGSKQQAHFAQWAKPRIQC